MDCKLMEDLLPLYKENLLQEENKIKVEDHLKLCPLCQRKIIDYDRPMDNENLASIPIKKIRHQLFWKKLIAVFSALFVFTLICHFFLKPIDLSYKEINTRMFSTNGEKFVDLYSYNVSFYKDPNENLLLNAWTNRWQKMTGEKTHHLFSLKEEGVKNVYYTPYTGGLAIPIHEEHSINGNFMILPRLVLSYYVTLAFMLSLLFMILYLFFKKKSAGKIFQRIGFFFLCYLCAHGFVKGTHTSSYHLSYDLLMILWLTLLFYGILQSFIELRK